MKDGVEYHANRRIRILKIEGSGEVKYMNYARYEQSEYRVQYISSQEDVIEESTHKFHPFENLKAARQEAIEFEKYCKDKYGLKFSLTNELIQTRKKMVGTILELRKSATDIEQELKRRKNARSI